ncbi:MAG: WecB/TagA/CpsF family glycosyltransferase [Candidatus Margulisiibacteriota bacterium]
MNNLPINSFPVSTLSQQQILNKIHVHIKSFDSFLPVLTLNISMFGLHPKPLQDWLIQHAFITPDGMGISLLSLFKHLKWIKRYAGIDMVNDLLGVSEIPFSVALIGGNDAALNGAIAYVKQFGHSVIFSQNGFSNPISEETISKLSTLKPQLILVAMGCPKQDEFIFKLSHHLSAGVAIGVGGSFDVWANLKPRAPKVVQWLGLEWLFRAILEPQRFLRLWRVFLLLLKK